jgi:hypothetical protein
MLRNTAVRRKSVFSQLRPFSGFDKLPIAANAIAVTGVPNSHVALDMSRPKPRLMEIRDPDHQQREAKPSAVQMPLNSSSRQSRAPGKFCFMRSIRLSLRQTTGIADNQSLGMAIGRDRRRACPQKLTKRGRVPPLGCGP